MDACTKYEEGKVMMREKGRPMIAPTKRYDKHETEY